MQIMSLNLGKLSFECLKSDSTYIIETEEMLILSYLP